MSPGVIGGCCSYEDGALGIWVRAELVVAVRGSGPRGSAGLFPSDPLRPNAMRELCGVGYQIQDLLPHRTPSELDSRGPGVFVGRINPA